MSSKHYLRFGKDLESLDQLRRCRSKCPIYIKMVVSQFPSINKEAGESDYCQRKLLYHQYPNGELCFINKLYLYLYGISNLTITLIHLK